MITVDHIHTKTANIIELSDKTGTYFAKIDLNSGASLQALKIEGKQILANLHPLKYEHSFNAALLFPFANRIDNGVYSYNNKSYQLKCNEINNNNALHGLIYNKKFKLISKKTGVNSTSVNLEYIETVKNAGFPFTYKIQLIYKTTKKSLRLKVRIENTDTLAFPFTLGWHPYFYSSNLMKSNIHFHADKKVIHNKKKISEGMESYNSEKKLKLADKNLDDCFHLSAKKIKFKTPKYHLALKTTAKNNYLQIYTPDNANAIAIEPLTGISNSFNNKEGLQVLEPNAAFSTTWKLKIIN
ncbi:MAG: aldose 1-epimerase [Polaribacter sp.]|uniref:aldose 1-epimerase n=1 Tax=Polaribacter sp. TaxID=1920175 RepID=UPI003851665A